MKLYTIETNQFYKIWFSKNPEVALGIENELALVQLRDKHPNAEISLVYSSECLSQSAIAHLKQFAKKHKIKLVDFDTDLENSIANAIPARPATEHPFQDTNIPLQDQKLYYLAKEEIQKAVQNKGGNLAAASDITRLLEPIMKLGMYSDFDVDLDFSKFSGQAVLCKSPLLIQAARNPISMNNECITVAKTMTGEIHPTAQKKLQKIKADILKNYKQPQKALFASIAGSLSPLMTDLLLAMPVNQFFTDHPKASIFEFRQYVDSLTLTKMFASLPAPISEEVLKKPYSPELSEEALKIALGQHINEQTKKAVEHARTIYESLGLDTKMDPIFTTAPLNDLEAGERALRLYRHILYNQSVTHITGPYALLSLMGTNNSDPGLELERYAIANSPLDGCVYSTNNLAHHQDVAQKLKPGQNALDIVGSCGHQSWSPVGAQKKAERQQKMDKAARTIQTAWMHHKKRAKKPEHPTTEKPAVTIHTKKTQTKKEKPNK